MADDGPSISPEDAALIANAIMEKQAAEGQYGGKEWGTVVAMQYSPGLTPMVVVSPPNAMDGQTLVIPSATGTMFMPGQRVLMDWDPPAGCYVMGVEGMAPVPVARMSLHVGGGES